MIKLSSLFAKQKEPAAASPAPQSSVSPLSMRHPLKKDALETIKGMGLTIETVIDVGVQAGTGELMTAFPKAFHLLIEPIEEWVPQITKGYTKAGIPHEIVTAGAAEIDGELTLALTIASEKNTITHARFTEETTDKDIRVVPVRTVDGLIAERDLAQPFLLKIDVDGAESRVIEGAKHVLQSASIVIVEVQTGNFMERSSPILEAGFELFDVVDLCYYNNRLAEMDLIFIRKQIVQDNQLGIFSDGFSPEKWKPYKP